MADHQMLERTEEAPSRGQLEAARSLPDNTAPQWPAANLKIPAADYIDPAHYALERKHLFEALPIAIAPSVFVAPGASVCRDDYGVPIILTRDKAGQVHAFVNACRHRGSRLVSHQDPESGGLFVCPYHAWSYDLSGKLVGVPRAEVFSELDKTDMGLVPLPCEERGGIIWVRLDPKAPADFSHIGPELTEDLDALGVADMHLFAHRRHEVAGNWKLIMDTFLEGYHVTRLHAKTLGPVSEDVTVKLDHLGSHLRQTSGRINFRQTMVEEAAHSMRQLRRAVVFVYTLVPNAVLICSTDFTNLLIFEPRSQDETLVENFMLTAHVPNDEKIQGKWERSLHRTDDQAFPEDFFASASSHQGLSTGVIDHLTLGGMEMAIKVYHDILHDLIEKGRAAV